MYEIAIMLIPVVGMTAFVLYLLYKRKHSDTYEYPKELEDRTTRERLDRHEKLMDDFYDAVNGRR